MGFAIKVENLGKKYIIRHKSKASYNTLRDVLAEKTKGLFSSIFSGNRDPIRSNRVSDKEEFWALKDINFEINKGDRVGVIGRNGAGKSTLLKILSRITEPSEGRFSIKGRIASLLEVGTGFHPELTGRENIFLNGAILGMKRSEIKAKFDEIVDFSGVEKFLDTPVKRYSSGMYVRLAFAVAAHLESEILIVDEVLAVGDAEFQKKCLGKMQDISNSEGRTVLFVSHNMSAVEILCNRGIVLSNGTIIFDGAKNDAINKYTNLTADIISGEQTSFTEGDLTFSGFTFFDETDEGASLPFVLRTGKKIVIEFEVRNNSSVARKGQFNFEIKSLYGSIITCFGNEFNNKVFEIKEYSSSRVRIESNNINFMPNEYRVNFFYTDETIRFYKTDLLKFEIVPADLYGTGLLPNSNGQGFILPEHEISYTFIK